MPKLSWCFCCDIHILVNFTPVSFAASRNGLNWPSPVFPQQAAVWDAVGQQNLTSQTLSLPFPEPERCTGFGCGETGKARIDPSLPIQGKPVHKRHSAKSRNVPAIGTSSLYVPPTLQTDHRQPPLYGELIATFILTGFVSI